VPVSKRRIAPKTITLVELLSQLAYDQSDQTMQRAYNNLALLTADNIEQVLGTLLDPMSFPELHHFAEGLKKAYQRVEKESVTSPSNLGSLLGAIGLVSLTLDLLNIAEWQGQATSPPDLGWSQVLLKEPAVRYWFKQVYAPPQRLSNHQNTPAKQQEAAQLKLARKHWRDLDFDSLELYRVGTTSFILRCQIPLLAGEKLVLKCLLFPYTRIPAISESTRNYSWSSQGNTVPATVRALSSTNKWILMDFVDGLNLREFLQVRRMTEGQQPPHLRTDLLASVGRPLLAALTHLSQAGIYHEDLTPSNIMVHKKTDGSIDQITLIDIGRNYLYTRHVGIKASREALFAAPEVKAGQKTEETSDLYSFGMILIELADPIGVQGGIIPESLYQYAPHLARFIEDLVDAKPENRRLTFPIKDWQNPYADLCQLFDDLLKILPSEREMKPRRFFWAQQFLALFYPNRQLKHAWRLWRMTRSSSMHPELAKHTGWLFGWLVMIMFTSWAIFSISLVWGARDFGMNPFLPAYISIPQTLIQGCGGMCLPLQNLFYTYGVENLPMRMMGLSCGLAQSAYYTNIFAGLTTRSMKGKLASITECFLRFQTIVAWPFIIVGNLIHPEWWLALYILWGFTPAMINTLCHKLATNTLRKARRAFSTVPLVDDPSLENFGHWGTSLFAYIVAMCFIWAGLHFGKLYDIWAYAGIATAINLFTLCISKGIRQAPGVRGCLSRAFTLGERLKALAQRSRKTILTP
jgi:serine/threonine protein kinase